MLLDLTTKESARDALVPVATKLHRMGNLNDFKVRIPADRCKTLDIIYDRLNALNAAARSCL